MNILQEATVALLSGLTTKNEDGSINWDGKKVCPLDVERETYLVVRDSADGFKKWYKNGELHREDGPAVVRKSGYKQWWLNGKIFSEEMWKVELKK